MNRYRAVLVGAGAIAKVHERALQASGRSELAAVADIDTARAQELAESHGAAVYADYREMVRKERPDIAIITLPHYLHREAAIFCMEQGCHIMLEKPMALDERQCADINEAAAKHRVTVAVGHMQRFYAANRKAKEIVDSGRLGQLVAIHERRHHPYFLPERPGWFLDKARSGGGVVINLGSHSIDRIQWLTGTPIVKAMAKLTSYGERGDVEGSGLLWLQTSAGVPATVSLCGYDTMSLNETELFFTGGQLKVTGQSKVWIGSFGKEYEPVPLDASDNPFEAQWESLLDSLDRGVEPNISGAYGQSVCAVVDAVYRSHGTGAAEEVGLLAGRI